MIAIQVNTLWLDFEPEASFTFSIENPIFDRDRIVRSWSFPIRLPATPNNLRALEYTNRLDTVNNTPRFPADLYLGGILYERGLLEVSSTSSRIIVCAFRSLPLDLLRQLRSINLRDLTIPVSVTTTYTPSIVVGVGWSVPTGGRNNFALQINDDIFEGFIGDPLTVFLNKINAVYPGLAFDSGLGGPDEHIIILAGNAYDPDNFQVTLRPDFGDVTTHWYFQFVGSNLDDEITRIQGDWATHLTDTLSSPTTHVFPTVRADSFYDQRNPLYSGYLNYYSDDEYPQNDSTETSRQWQYTLVPMPFVHTVLQAIIDNSDIEEMTGAWYNDAEIRTLIVWNNVALDKLIGEWNYIVEQGADEFRNVFQENYDLADHLPDISAYDFLIYLAGTFCLYLSYDNEVLTINAIQNLLSLPAEDWTDKADPEYKQSFNYDAAYTLDYDRQGDETEVAGQLEKVDGGDEATTFTSPWFTLFTANEADPFVEGRKWRIPFITEVGFSTPLELDELPSLRLLFYRGLADSYAVGSQYPLAQHDATDYAGTSTGSYSLDWQGDKGLFEIWWKDYINLIRTGRTVKKAMRLTVADIIEIKKFRNIRKTIYHNQGQITAVIRQVRFKVDRTGITSAEVTFVTE